MLDYRIIVTVIGKKSLRTFNFGDSRKKINNQSGLDKKVLFLLIIFVTMHVPFHELISMCYLLIKQKQVKQNLVNSYNIIFLELSKITM